MSARRLPLLLSVGLFGIVGLACDQSDDPEGLECTEIESSTVCGADGESRAFCMDNREGNPTYGQCLAPEQIECEPGDVRSTPIPGADPYDPCKNNTYWCVLDSAGTPTWEYQECITPLVLDFDRATPIEMIDAEATPTAASFDINDDGRSCTSTDWPTAATPWLVLDRDDNGAIEGGRELFGSGTRLGDGKPAAHGFEALAELDVNGDGRIDREDPAFAELMLWRDHDADRRSSFAELEPLASAVDGLDLGYEVRRECDTRGNCGIQRSSFTALDGQVGELVDLYLACQ